MRKSVIRRDIRMEFAVGISNQLPQAKMQSSTLIANTMDIHSDFAGAPSSKLFIDVSVCKNEDSGYHTSFTPGSLERSEICSEYRDQSMITTKACITGQFHYVTPDINTNYGRQSSTKSETPLVRRVVKRSYQDTEISDFPYSPIPTPTSLIAGQIKSLDFNQNKENTYQSISSASPDRTNSHTRRLCREYESYPLTPIKRNCKLNPCRKSAKKLNFVIHSLSCESRELQPANRLKGNAESVKTALFRPDKKIDIMQLLYQKGNAMPPITTIFSYLSNEDIYNFNMVSRTWCEIWESVSDKQQRQKFEKYLKNAKENRENQDKNLKNNYSKINTARPGCLKELYYEQIMSTVCNSPISPPGTPRTNKFKKFTKSASMDSRAQLSCVRCSQPAKVTEETSGEEWAECTSNSCSYQFCRYCHSDRHPDRTCFQYDLNGPSPSKRKKIQCTIGTKKSRKNLRRLL